MDQPVLFSLPLFPLRTVLYPGMVLPLRIFEDRYKAMIQYCMDEKSDFGVLLIAKGEEVGEAADPFEIGTIAKIIQIQHLNDAGEMMLMAVGTNRFKVWDQVVSPEGYLVGTVSQLVDEELGLTEAATMVDTMRETLSTYLGLAFDPNDTAIDELTAKLSTDPEALSYQIATMLDIDLRTKQSLLESARTLDRLEKELEILKLEIVFLKRNVGPKTFKLPGGGEVNLN